MPLYKVRPITKGAKTHYVKNANKSTLCGRLIYTDTWITYYTDPFNLCKICKVVQRKLQLENCRETHFND